MPWKLHNPFDKEPQEEPEPSSQKPSKPIPSTMVRVVCEGCAKAIDIRVAHKNNGRKTVSCHNCLQVIEVTVNSMKSIEVWTFRQNGANRHRTSYEKIWQEE